MPDIRHSISVGAAQAAIAGLVSSGPGLRQWWAEDVETGAQGVVSLGFFDRATVYRLRLLEPGPARVVWRCESGLEWQDTELLFNLRPEGTGVLLEFVHAKWREATPPISCRATRPGVG